MINRDLDRRPEDDDAVWANVAAVAVEVEADLDVLVKGVEDRVVARIQAANGPLSAPLQDVLRRGLFAALRDALARLRSDADLPQELPPDMIELARLSADPQYELTGLADAWLVGGEVFWDRFQTVAEQTLQDTAVCWDVVKAARVRLGGHAARVSELFRSACETEAARAAGIDEERGLRAVSRVLEGQWLEPSELGYDLAYHHVAIVADAPEPVVGLARRAGRPLLLVKGPDGEMWAWLGGATRIADSDLDALIASLDPREGHVAFGEPAAGIAGFAASHHQALEAKTIAAATSQPAVRFADLRLVVALLRDNDLAKGFIERELGELDDSSERMGELRETLRAYLEHGQSVSATAAVRHRDRKTIERQLRSAEGLLEHRVSDRCDELLIALRIADILRSSA
ncbi:MAG: PucR family transcriptional regulator [Solirubrobacteraceae bacterium]